MQLWKYSALVYIKRIDEWTDEMGLVACFSRLFSLVVHARSGMPRKELWSSLAFSMLVCHKVRNSLSHTQEGVYSSKANRAYKVTNLLDFFVA